jgi:hypothetical protein
MTSPRKRQLKNMVANLPHSKNSSSYATMSVDSKTRHFLAQYEWYNKLKNEYGCIFVTVEQTAPARAFGVHVNPHIRSHFIFDVYGETADGIIFIVEVGNISSGKLKQLQDIARINPKIRFIHVDFDGHLSKTYPLMVRNQITREIQLAKFRRIRKKPSPRTPKTASVALLHS